MAKNRTSSVSHAKTDKEIGEFWDSHDFTDFDDLSAPDIPFQISFAVPLERELYAALERQATTRGIQLETLVNLWLQQKLDEMLKPETA